MHEFAEQSIIYDVLTTLYLLQVIFIPQTSRPIKLDLSPKRINTETSNMGGQGGGHTTLVENGHEQLKQTSRAFISFRNICHEFVCCICIVQSQYTNVKLFKA